MASTSSTPKTDGDVAGGNSSANLGGNGVRLYPDGSLRTPDGKFSSASGNPAPGTIARKIMQHF